MPRKPLPESAWPASSIEIWPLDKIRRYARNAKSHPAEQIKALADSMREFGVTTAMLLDEAGEIIAGHGRLEAAEQNGYTSYPVMIAKGWSDVQKRAYRLADNVIPTTGGAVMMPDLVKIELADLKDMDFDITRFGLDDLELPEIEEDDTELLVMPRRERSKKTVFVSVINEEYDRAKALIIKALDDAAISHNL